MFGAEGFGELAFSEFVDTPLDSDGFVAFLARVSAPRCWVLELDVFSLASVTARAAEFGDAGFGELAFADGDAGVTGGVSTLRFSSSGYTTASTDSPARTYCDARITGDVTVERSIAGRGGIGGLARMRGEVRLVNTDGALDTIRRDYSLEGRRARILLGDPSAALSTFGIEFTGVVETVTIGQDTVTLALSDGIRRLDVPVNATVYAGSGGTEGGTDLKGKPKPKAYGSSWNVSAPLVDSANLIYQVHDGAVNDVPAAYDRQVALTKVAGAPAAGQYQVTASAGTVKLGATPAGTVTFDVQGDTPSAGYVNRTADIVSRLLAIAGLTSSEIDPVPFGQLNTEAGAEVGVWVGADVRTVGDVVDELLAGVGAFGGFNRFGAFTVGVVKAAAGTPDLTLSQDEILDIERVPAPAAVEPIVWRARVGWQKNYTPQPDLASGVTAARRTFANEEWRMAESSDSGVRSRHLLAVEYGPVESLYAQSADAVTEAVRLFTLWSGPRAFFRVSTTLRAIAADLGAVVQLTHARFGLSAGAPGVVLQQLVRGTRVELLWMK